MTANALLDGDDAERMLSEQWGAGLPIIAPTEERVRHMLAAVPLDGDHVLGHVPPRGGEATVVKVAANAVMAGCRPRHFPIVVAAVQGVLTDEFNLHSVQTLGHVSSIVIVLGGRSEFQGDFNSGPNLFGAGSAANAQVARALTLTLINLGYGEPEGDAQRWGRTVHCIAEDEGGSPWPSAHGAGAGPPGTGSVMVFAGESPHCVVNFVARRGHELIQSLSDVLLASGTASTGFPGECLIVLSAEHAEILAADGMSREDVQRSVFDLTKRPRESLRHCGLYGGRFERYPALRLDDGAIADEFSVIESPERARIIVAGGRAGKFSAIVPGWGYVQSRSASVALPD